MDVQSIIESMKTESIINYLLTVDFIKLLKNPFVIVLSLLTLLVMGYLKMIKTIATIFSIIILWIVAVNFVPSGGAELELKDMGIFIVICMGIAAALIYVFLIKGD